MEGGSSDHVGDRFMQRDYKGGVNFSRLKLTPEFAMSLCAIAALSELTALIDGFDP